MENLGLKAFEKGWIRYPRIQNSKNPFLMISEFHVEKVVHILGSNVRKAFSEFTLIH